MRVVKDSAANGVGVTAITAFAIAALLALDEFQVASVAEPCLIGVARRDSSIFCAEDVDLGQS